MYLISLPPPFERIERIKTAQSEVERWRRGRRRGEGNGGKTFWIALGYRQGGAIGVLFALSNCLAVS
eukprot:558082-Amorphochlora_amoeboformis.AAC.1